MTALPTGWTRAPLGEVAPEVKTSAIQPTPGVVYELWSVPSFADGIPEVVDGAAVGSSKRPVEPDDVLICKINPRINRVWKVSAVRAHAQVASPEWIAVRPKAVGRVIPDYLRLYLSSPKFRNWIRSEVSSVTGSHTRAKPAQVMAQEIAFPSLEGQRRIVGLLEAQLSRLDAADRTFTRARGSTKAMLRASLSAGLRARLVEDDPSEGTARDLIGTAPSFEPDADDRVWPVPDTWAWARMGDIFQINVGTTPSRAAAELWSGDLPWVSSGEVAFCRISATREHITRRAAGNTSIRIHPPGTVMLAMIGEGKTRGQAAILDIEAAHNQNCASIRVGATRVLPEYIFGYLQDRYLETRRGGSGGQQPALNKSAIQRFPVPIAPLGTQRRLVAAWTEARAAVDRLDHDLQLLGQRSVHLRQSLLSVAFYGRLTGTTSNFSDIE